MDDKRQEIMDIMTKVFSDEASVRTLLEAETVEEIQYFMEGRGVTATQTDCKLILLAREKSFVESVAAMKSAKEVQRALEERGISLSLDECNFLRITADASIMESLAKAKNTEEVRNILEEKGINFSPEVYSNLEWNLELDVELSEDELTNVVGGLSWKVPVAVIGIGIGVMAIGPAIVGFMAGGAIAAGIFWTVAGVSGVGTAIGVLLS